MTRSRFGTPIDPSIDAALMAPVRTQPLAIYFQASPMRKIIYNFLAVESMSDRLRFICEILLPSGSYMRVKYGSARVTWLPWLYARRVIEGIKKRI